MTWADIITAARIAACPIALRALGNMLVWEGTRP